VQLRDGVKVSAMCAIDALGIPLMTGRDAMIVSADPSDGRAIHVARRGDTWRWEPADTVVLVAQAHRSGWAADCLCPSITFHTDQRAAEDHLGAQSELSGVVLDQDQAVDVARCSFGLLLAPDTETPPPQPAKRNNQ
jgi:alkylmercury lyase